MNRKMDVMLRTLFISSTLVLGGCVANTSKHEDPEVLGAAAQNASENRESPICHFSTAPGNGDAAVERVIKVDQSTMKMKISLSTEEVSGFAIVPRQVRVILAAAVLVVHSNGGNVVGTLPMTRTGPGQNQTYQFTEVLLTELTIPRLIDHMLANDVSVVFKFEDGTTVSKPILATNKCRIEEIVPS